MTKESILQAPSKAAAIFAKNRQFHKAAEKISLVGWVLVGLIVLCDVWLAADGRDGNTWSELMRTYGRTHLILPWLCGTLIGHLFYTRDNPRLWGNLSLQQGSSLIFWFSAIFFLVGIVAFQKKLNVPSIFMTLTAFAGIGAGHFLWPFRRD